MNRVSITKHGTKYEYSIPIKGINNQIKNVIVVYIINNKSRHPRLVTNYVEGKK